MKQAEIEAEVKAIATRLVIDMKAADKKSFVTEHGLVTFLSATPSHPVPDIDAATLLLAKHGEKMPTKPKAGMPDRIEFRKSG